MPNEIHESLVIYRLNSAEEKLRSAKLLLDNAQYKDSIGRSYYAIFSAVRAVLALDEVDFKKHAGVISYFQKTYIKTEIFDKKYSRYLMTAFQIRIMLTMLIFILLLQVMQKNNIYMPKNC